MGKNRDWGKVGIYIKFLKHLLDRGGEGQQQEYQEIFGTCYVSNINLIFYCHCNFSLFHKVNVILLLSVAIHIRGVQNNRTRSGMRILQVPETCPQQEEKEVAGPFIKVEYV